jgi:major membrane immunogen (membrane-anchored lipoprotein)
MKKRFRLIFLLVSILMALMLLTGCGDSDWEYMLMGLMAWAEEHSIIVNEEFQPGALAAVIAQDSVDDWRNAPGAIQLDGLEEVRKIEMANDLSDEALKTLDDKKMDQAISLRPNDYVLYEKDAILWAVRGNSAASSQAILDADVTLKENLQYGDDCIAARRAQLRSRLTMIRDEIQVQKTLQGENYVEGELHYMYDYTSYEIQEIDSSGWTNFCSGLMD